MAMAASLLVLIGGATWWATITMSRGTQPSKLGPVALNDKVAGPAELRAERTAEPAKIDEGTRMAVAPESKRGDSNAAAALLKDVEPKGDAPAVPDAPVTTIAAAAEADAVGPVRSPMDSALAADLARERKLVIRVVSREATSQPRRVCDRVKKECNSAAWKLAGHVPSDLTVALDAKPLDVERTAPQVIQPELPAFAGDSGIEPIMGPPAPREIAVIDEAEPQPVYIVQARLDAATMTQLRASLERGSRDEVVF
jgi:hypothetical protein